MTENDRKLIAEAWKMPYTDWMDIEPMGARADTDECREWLHHIASSKYHTEEYYADMI